MTTKSVKLCSGLGKFHSDGGSYPKPLRSITFDAVEKMLTKPQLCEKEKAEWVIFTDTKTRQKHKLVEANARYFALWSDVDDMQGVALETLTNQLAEWIDGYLFSYTTKTATTENQKARIVIPLISPITLDDFEKCQTVINDKLEQLGVIPDRATQRPTQICYLPNAGGFYQHFVIGELSLSLNPLERFQTELIELEQREIEQLKQRKIGLQQRISTTAKRMASNQLSVIDAFNQAFTEGDMLERNGYKRKGEGRYLSPYSMSGSAGITLLDDGRIYSHGNNDPLADGFPHDAFDLFKTLEHNGDQTKALKAAGGMFTNSDGLSLTKANQISYMKAKNEKEILTEFTALLSKVDADGVLSVEPNAKADDPQPPTQQAPKKGYRLISVSELLKNPQPISWLVKDYIETNATGLLFGASGSGKSLIVASLAACVATGTDWFGHQTKQGGVVIFLGEGHTGFRRRLKGIEAARGFSLADCPLFVSNMGTGLDTHEGLKEAVTALDALPVKPVLIVVDTMARHMQAGDENSNTDVNKFVAALDRLRSRYEATIMLVHHTGHDATGRARGASALKGAMDFSYRLESPSTGTASFICDKAKDFTPPAPKRFDIKEQVTAWSDPDTGESISTAIVELSHDQSTGAKVKKLSDSLRFAFKTFATVSNRHTANLESWRVEFYKRHHAATVTAKRVAFNRVRKELVEMGLMSVIDDSYRLSEKAATNYPEITGL
jgi:hypothetical protein